METAIIDRQNRPPDLQVFGFSRFVEAIFGRARVRTRMKTRRLFGRGDFRATDQTRKTLKPRSRGKKTHRAIHRRAAVSARGRERANSPAGLIGLEFRTHH